jgi:hypothetical protein
MQNRFYCNERTTSNRIASKNMVPGTQKTWCLAPKSPQKRPKHGAWHPKNTVPGTQKHPKIPISRDTTGRVLGCLAPSWKELVGAWHRVGGCLAPSAGAKLDGYQVDWRWGEKGAKWSRAILHTPLGVRHSSDAQSRGKALPSPRVPTTRDDNWAEWELLAAPDQIALSRSHSNRPDPASSTAADHFPSTR